MLGVEDNFFYRDILDMDESSIEDAISALNGISNVTNSSASTTAQAEEDVEDIRSTAPDYYKLGNRLVSKSDFEYYVKNRFKDNIVDVVCQNNWGYISTFYRWLYYVGKNGVRTQYSTLGKAANGKSARISDPSYYINQSRILKYDYYYADPAD